jgi:plasmid maintenance system killer protein
MVWSKLAQARGGQTLFALAVRSIPNKIQRRARAKLFAVDAAKQLDDLRVPPGNRLGTVIDAVSIVSALTINGGSASGGAKAKHGKLK